MPFDEIIALAKIEALLQKNRDLNKLEHDTANVINSFQELLDVQEQDKETDGTPKTDQRGQPILIKVMPMDQNTLEKLTTARRNTVYDKMILAADAVLARTA